VTNRLLALILVFAPFSLTSFGGGQAIIASIDHQAVEVHHWLTHQEFTDLFALSRAAPGPSTLIAALIGWQVDGFWGALVATVAIFLPSSILFVALTRLWIRYEGSRLSSAITRGLAPVTVGLVFAGALAVIQSAHMSLLQIAITMIAAALLYFTSVGPFVLIGGVIAFYSALLVLDTKLLL